MSRTTASRTTQRSKRITTIAAGVLGAVLVLTGCSAQTGGGGSGSADLSKVDYKGTITMVNKFSDPSTSKYFPAMAKAFEKLHPDVKVTVQQESDQGYKDKIKVLASSNSIPDIYFVWAGSYAKQYVDAGFAMDITSQIGEGTAWNKTLAPSAVKAGEYDGKNYGIPIDLDAKFMVYNKKIFADNGVAVPKTFNDLLAACKTFKDKGITPINFGNKDGWPALHYVTQLNAYNVPAATLQKDYTSAHGKFTDPGYVTALTQFKQLLTQCTASPTSSNGIDHTDAQVGFAADKSAMMYLEWVEFGLLDKTQLATDGWDFFKLPAASDASGDTGTLVGAPDEFLINPKSQNPALAVAFMKFVVSKQNAAKMQTLMVGYPSPVKGSLTADNSSPQSIQALDEVNKASGLAIWLDTVTPPAVASAYLAGGEALVSGTDSPAQVMQSVQKAAASSK
ncbi:MAG TPA: extracellular solute-binding protein [Microbacteriaceae bacterium]|jgi:raffinose/stachyose/melibiose transport system substrate-binding protein|nr:extracellular solute-binding protein [Microbacteriaceae bacterium]